MNINKTLTVTLAGVVSAAVVLLTGDLTAQQRPAGPFTAAQVAAGKAAYEKNCSSCHLPTLAGSGDASALAGTPFMSGWGARNAGQLHSFIQSSMPPTAANGTFSRIRKARFAESKAVKSRKKMTTRVNGTMSARRFTARC